jgi:2,5-diketo-D-gluconate reductase B
MVGFGTFRLTGAVAFDSVQQALEVGYRHIDTAQAYNNESDVGRAIDESVVSRNDVFITTKVWNDNLSDELFLDSVKESLVKLKTDYVDLLLIHWPAPPSGTTLEQSVLNLHKAKSMGLARNIGVSNFTIAQVKQALLLLPEGSLLTNQIEVHPYLQNKELVAFCQENNVLVTAYMPFAVGKVLSDKTIVAIAKEHDCSSAEVVIAWLKQQHIATIPSSTKKHNMELNRRGLNVSLTPSEMEKIAELNSNDRLANPDFSPAWD